MDTRTSKLTLTGMALVILAAQTMPSLGDLTEQKNLEPARSLQSSAAVAQPKTEVDPLPLINESLKATALNASADVPSAPHIFFGNVVLGAHDGLEAYERAIPPEIQGAVEKIRVELREAEIPDVYGAAYRQAEVGEWSITALSGYIAAYEEVSLDELSRDPKAILWPDYEGEGTKEFYQQVAASEMGLYAYSVKQSLNDLGPLEWDTVQALDASAFLTNVGRDFGYMDIGPIANDEAPDFEQNQKWYESTFTSTDALSEPEVTEPDFAPFS